MSRRPARPLRWLVARWPRACLALASLLDRLVQRKLFNRRDRIVMLGHFEGGNPWPYPELASGPAPQALRPPMILATLHLGAIAAIGALLERLPGQVLAFVWTASPPRPGVTLVEVGRGEDERAMAFKRGIDALRAGEFVFAAADAEPGGPSVEIAGRRLSLARGPFALARLTGAPLVPVIARWQGRKLAFELGDRITPADEGTMGRQFADWVNACLTRHPSLLDSPLADRLFS